MRPIKPSGNGPYDYHMADDHVGIYRAGGHDFVQIVFADTVYGNRLCTEAALLCSGLNRGIISVAQAVDLFGITETR